MFREADSENSGYLTFDQFQQLMEKINLGISSQELRFVISEADENENESQGSDLQRYLFDLCKIEEDKMKQLKGGEDNVSAGS
eukprot:gene18004-23642_t